MYLTINGVRSILIKPRITMQPRTLIKWEFRSIRQQKTISPFRTHNFFYICFWLFLFYSIRKMDCLIMMREEGNDNMVCTFFNCTNRNPRPLGCILGRWRVPIVPSAEEEDTELDMYWELGIVGVIVKDRMVFDLGNKTVEGLRLNLKLATEMFRAMSPPVI